MKHPAARATCPKCGGTAYEQTAHSQEGNRSPKGKGGSKDAMKHTTKEIRAQLLDELAKTTEPTLTGTIRDTIEHINQMAADLRRAGFAEYDRNEKE